MYAVSFIYSNLNPHCFPFSSLQGNFFSLQGKWYFSPLPPSMIVFSIKLINLPIDQECDHLFVFRWLSSIQYQAFVSSPFGGWQGGSAPRGGLPEREYKTDRHSSSIARSQGSACKGECYTNAPIHLWTPPTPPIYRGMLNRYSPSRETLQRWHLCACPSDTWLGGWGVGC